MDTPQLDSSPIIWGAKAIATTIGKTPRATFHLLERGVLPCTRKVGRQWVADRDALLSYLRGSSPTIAG